MNPKALRLLGLAYRAGKVAWGLEAVRSAKARLILLADGAGNAVTREIVRLSDKTGTPVKGIPADKNALGRAIGKSVCAVVSVNDEGFAKSIALALEEAQTV
ncbi:MAG: ribosomal L7Ae/L30e/S12e/Gadd45 family protein [Oscillospiraceae bacterium]|jgi:ribosomal protein L7Ae-like RNA K-turn-binding protein|nr:ribosomal L7Ae/L30e/S12e/Gadd45 family protein [Oscillospiraceae bacterium]